MLVVGQGYDGGQMIHGSACHNNVLPKACKKKFMKEKAAKAYGRVP
jgi:hypothetical protein